jgi:hypothetical protein
MKMNNIKIRYNHIAFIAAFGILFSPIVTFAAGTTLTNLVTLIETTLKSLFPIMTALGILVFGYNVEKYLTSKNLEDQNIYKSGLLNSIFALFIFFTIMGLISILARSMGIPLLGEDIGLAGGQKPIFARGEITTFRNIILTISSFISGRIIPILISFGVLAFLGNIVISMSKSDEEKERELMNQYLRWGILALFVLFTFFSIVSMFTGTLFGFKAVIPQFQTQN